jgi:bifunctional UDP-N-acetylglucosamine pyrophosphorylase/glucosamine-1-phosphate N-acetyltransferase
MATGLTRSKLESTTALILAAGLGTRMKSSVPKVLHGVCGRPLVFYPVRAALDAGCGEVVVIVGRARGDVETYLASTFGSRVRTAVQDEQRGTGDAARAGMGAVGASATRVLIANSDTPLVSASDIARVVEAFDASNGAPLALATCTVSDAHGYGRVLRDGEGRVREIREHKDLATDAERACREINPGIYLGTTAFMREALHALQPNNAQREYYLTDVVAMAAAGAGVVAVPSPADVLLGVNDRVQLEEAERAMYAKIARAWRVAGVTVREGARIDDGVDLAADVTIESGVILRGTTKIARGARVDVGSVLTNVVVGEDVVIKPYSVLSGSTVGARAQIGPFSHLRPDSDIGEEAHVGNFVETKKTSLGKGAKANHLAYLGDGRVGEGANIGAGTIFCNYDGFRKHTTVVEKGAFVGSDSQLVAPVTVGEGAYVATGTTVTKDVPANALAISRTRQENKEGYASKLRVRLKGSGS